MVDLEKARNSINRIDKEMASLFEERMIAVKDIALYKKQVGLQVYDEKREQEVINNNSSYIDNNEFLPYYVNFIKSNMKISRAYQRRIISGTQIAISGTKGAFADITANKVFPEAENVSFSDFLSAYKSVEKGESDLAFLPLENSFGGDVGAVLDLSFFGTLYINGIYESSIVQNLVGLESAKLSDIKTVFSHPQALLQCSEFIRENGFNTEESLNTTAAAKTVLDKNDKTVAAICSAEAANTFGLKIIKSHINESNQNTTRFAVFSRTMKEANDIDDRFVLMFTVKNTAGALSKAITVIGKYGFNLLDLKSRPTKLENWNHYFYIEGEGNIYSDSGKAMIEELEKCCDNFKIVGSFKKEARV